MKRKLDKELFKKNLKEFLKKLKERKQKEVTSNER